MNYQPIFLLTQIYLLGNLLSIFNILGQKQKIEYNNKPLLYLYDNGKTIKKIVID